VSQSGAERVALTLVMGLHLVAARARTCYRGSHGLNHHLKRYLSLSSSSRLG
jgi:hypothetical protein